MGKKQHQKDKMYLTSTEWAWLYGGRRPDQRSLDELAARIARLPFNHCCLSLQPVTNPVCTTEGYIFEKDNLTAFVAKYKCDPITGNKKFSLEKDVFALNFHKNAEGDFHCPVLMKNFSENSKIAAIRTSGNVFSHEAVEELNLKTKNYRDLLTDQPFVRNDVIILQDPLDTSKVNPSQFYHFKQRLRWRPSSDDEDDDQDNKSESTTATAKKKINKMDNVTRSTLQELDSKLGEGSTKSEGDKLLFQSQKTVTKERDQFNTALFSTGRAAASLTSTVMDAHTSVDAAVISDDIYKYSQVKKKGYVTVETNLGPLNLELYCQHAPKTCENFFLLSRKGYYDGTSFHRLIKNFMIQGGDPTGTGTGGESAFGQPFKDEFNQHLSHSGRGIVSMANSGPNTNKSQFFITFRSCKHLDRKHTVFGKVVGGIETLDKLERIETDAKDHPKEPLIIKKIVIYVDPFKEVEEYIESEREKKRKATQDDKQVKDSTRDMKRFRSGVGAFIDMSTVSSKEEPSQPQATNNTSTAPSLPVKVVGKSTKKNKMTSGSFGNFSNW